MRRWITAVMCGLAAPAWAEPEPHFGAPELLTFDNGLRLVLQPDPRGTTVSMVTRVDAGWDADPADATGLAHLVEHLWFRRTAGDGDVWSAAQARACHSSATTAADVTRYTMRCPAMDARFAVEQAIAGASRPLEGVDPHQTALEVSIVDQELRERSDGDLDRTRAMYGALLPGDHQVHQLLADPDFDAPALSLDQAQSWTREHYRGQNLVITLVGAFDRDAAVSAFAEVFGDAVDTTPPPPAQAGTFVPPAPPHRNTPVVIESSKPLPTLMLGWNLPASFGSSALAAIAAEHLGDHLSDGLRDRLGVVSVTCGVQPMADAPSLICAIILTDYTPFDDDLDRDVNDRIEEAWTGSAREALSKRLKRARAEAPQDLLLRYASPMSRARRFAEQVARDEAPTPVETAIKQVRSWDPQGLIRVAPDWFSSDRAARVQVGVNTEATAPPLAPWREVSVSDGRDTEIYTGTRPAQSRTLPAPELAARRLPSGLTILGIRHADAPYVTVTARIPGGLGVGPAGLSQVAESLTVGSREDQAWGVRSGHHVGRDHIEVSAVAPRGHLYNAVEAVVRGVVLRAPVVDADQEEDDDLNRYVWRLGVYADAIRGTAPWRSEQALMWAVTPNHGAGTPLSKTDLTATQGIDSATLVAYLWRTYQPTHATVLVSGPQDPDTLVKVAARQFKRWKLHQGVIPGHYPALPAAGEPIPIEAIADDPSTNLGWVTWRCRLPDTPSAAERVVLRRAVEMAAFDELRHRRGLVYTPYVDLSHWPDGTATLEVAISGPPESSGIAVAALDDLQSSVDARVDAARDRSARALAHRLDSIVGYESLVALMTEGDTPPSDPVDAYLTRIEAVSKTGIHETMGACRTTRSFVVRGPADVLQPSLESSGYAPILLEAP